MNVKSLVEEATRGQSGGPDWGVILQLCDSLHENKRESVDVLRAFVVKLHDPDDAVVELTLVVLEACVKNGPSVFHEAVASPQFLQEVVALIDETERRTIDSSVRLSALKLIQQWGEAFGGQSGVLGNFKDTYKKLKLQGVVFPTTEALESAPVFTPPPSSTMPLASASLRIGSRGNSSSNDALGFMLDRPRTLEEEFKKLKLDLQVVEDKIVMFIRLSQRGEDAAEVYDFLDQCRPRMNTLIEAGIAGKLDEITLETCLRVNDDLVQALDGGGGEDIKSSALEIDLLNANDFRPSASLQPPSKLAQHADLDDFAHLNIRGKSPKISSLASLSHVPPPAPASTPSMTPVPSSSVDDAWR